MLAFCWILNVLNTKKNVMYNLWKSISITIFKKLYYSVNTFQHQGKSIMLPLIKPWRVFKIKSSLLFGLPTFCGLPTHSDSSHADCICLKRLQSYLYLFGNTKVLKALPNFFLLRNQHCFTPILGANLKKCSERSLRVLAAFYPQLKLSEHAAVASSL